MLKLEYKILSIKQVSETLEDKTKTGNEYPILSSTMEGIFLQTDYFNKQTASEDTTGYKKIPYGYFTYRSMSDTGSFSFNQQKLIAVGIVSPAYPVFRLRGVDDSYFYYFVNQSIYFKRQLYNLKQGGTRYALPFSRFSEFRIKIPKIEEQKRIGSFLSAFDYLIDKQKKKVDRIKMLKKGYLQKIFPAIEQDQYKTLSIGQITQTLEDKTDQNNEFPILSSAKGGIFLQTDYFNKQAASEDTTGYKKIPFGYFTYRSMSDTGEFKFNQQKIVPTGIVSPAYPVFCVNEVEDTYFYYYINESHFFKKQLSNSKQGGTRYALPFSRFSDFKIKVPDRTNQKIIGSFLSAIDRLIEKEEAAIERYESLKKGYLQRIFAD